MAEVEPKKQVNQSQYWCFTFNGYTDFQLETLEAYFLRGHFGFIMGKEIGTGKYKNNWANVKGTPHIQGYVEHEKRFRPSELKFDGCCTWHDMHFEARKGTQYQAAIYCAKDGDYVTNLACIKEPTARLKRAMMRPEQLLIADKYIEPENPLFGRQIHWYWEQRGGWGKSVLTKYMVDTMKAIVIGGSKEGDVLCGVTAAVEKGEVPIVIVDVPRHGKVCYRAIEKVKDGCFFNTKYESCMVRFNSPHILVFSNEPPDEEQFSADRWVVQRLS